MSTFREALGEASKSGLVALYIDRFPGKCADAILAMPEMQAIRSALRTMSEVIGDYLAPRGLTAIDALVGHLNGEDDPESVQGIIDWVLEDQ